MTTRRCNRGSLTIIFALLFVSALLPATLFGQTMTMSPHKIVLNAVGASEDVQAIIGMTLPGGYTITDFDITLKFDDQVVAEAASVYYCAIDDNLLVGFDKEQLLANPLVIAMAGTTVAATVEGTLVMTAADGSICTRTFDGFDYVEILAPGKAKDYRK